MNMKRQAVHAAVLAATAMAMPELSAADYLSCNSWREECHSADGTFYYHGECYIDFEDYTWGLHSCDSSPTEWCYWEMYVACSQ